MDKECFLSFNGKSIYFKEVSSEYWIAIKPICEALDIDYIRAFKNLSEDKILVQLLSEQTMVGADNKNRKMVCLPEKYIYGWIFSLRSRSGVLREYQLQCYEILFNYFNGTLIGRKRLLQKQETNQKEIERIEQQLRENQQYTALMKLKQERMRLKKQLKNIDKQTIENNPSLF
nr:MAG TPA: hypothetical protein [Caudoviricetes sp.]